MITRLIRARRRARSGDAGQSLLEFALLAPLACIMALGVVEVSNALIHQHMVTRLAREGANLISRDTSLEAAATALRTMSTSPVNFNDGSKMIFSVLKKGATTGSANYGQLILYQRYEYGSCPGASTVQMSGGGTFASGPNFEAANSDSNAGLRVSGVPPNIVAAPGNMIYVVEIYSRYQLITPFHRFGVQVPTTLYSIAYF